MIGFLGNEAVALFQIRTGNRIGSASLVADGLHARIDGLTSLVVLLAVAGSALGFPIVDPIVGLMIGVAILFIARDATIRIWGRLMDAVDPQVVDQIEQRASHIHGVARVEQVRLRWIGHQLSSDIYVALVGEPSFTEVQSIISSVKHDLQAHVRHLATTTVEIVPARSDGHDSTLHRSSQQTSVPPSRGT